MLSPLKTALHTRYHEVSTTSTSVFKRTITISKGYLDALSAKSFQMATREKFECNLCGWKGNHFVDFYTGYNFVYEKSVCPECFSHPRHRSYFYTLKKVMAYFGEKKIKVLHFAPEAIVTKIICDNPNVNYLSVDIDHRNAMRKEDIKNLSFQDNSFDLIICIHVLEHIDDDKKAMQELLRVLKPEGIALLDVPIDNTREITYEDWSITTPEARTKAFWQWDHVRLYGLDFPKKLREIGFVIEEDDYIKGVGDEIIQKQCLEVSVNYIGTKKGVS